jgi:anti-sigma factor RsiW
MTGATRNNHPDELLPWYANGTLPADERRAVEEHLAACDRCRRELALLASLRDQIKAEDTAPSPGELGWRRLQRDLRHETGAPRRRAWWQPALAAAAVIIVVQAALLVNLWTQPPAITPLGGPEAAGAVLQVRFAPRAAEADMRAALRAVNGEIVGGPGALGIYRIRLEGVAPENSVAIARAAQALRARSGVVAEVVAP